MLRRLGRIAFIGSLGAIGFGILLPNQYIPSSLLPIYHLVNVAEAGFRMSLTYKFSKKPASEKHTEAASYLEKALRKNGGIYIKLGQLISGLDVIVPDQYRDTMLGLTRGCQKSSFDNVKKIIENQTGKPLQETFLEFAPQPISSASIGQVHKAKLKTGQQVAVKIQHENLSENVLYDLQLMWTFVKMAKFMFKQFKFQWLIEQFEVNIQKQLDFRLEAVNMKRVKEMLVREKFKNVHVPKLLQEPTRKMLIMEYIHGFHIDEVQKMKMANINMKEIGKRFSKVIAKMIHKYGFVHADPHSGNLLVRKNSKGQDELYLLDHGLYQELDDITREDYNWFWLGLILNKEEVVVKAANQLGTKNGLLLCSMLTSQTREELTSPNRNIFDLNPSTDKSVIMKHAKEWHSQIIDLLNEIKREVLLLLKVNEFARTIENTLGGREMGVYQEIATCCVDNLPISRWQKLKYKWQMLREYRKNI